MSRSNIDCKVYVGDLGSNASQTELEDSFSYYGPLNSVWVARNPPGFAFVEFEDPRDARDAVRGLDGRTVCNRRITAEMSTGRSRSRGGGVGGSTGGAGGAGSAGSAGSRYDRGSGRYGGYNPNDRCYECGERGHYAYDCPSKRRLGERRGRTRSRSRSRDRRTKSRSLDRYKKSRTRSYTRSRSRDRTAKSRSRGHSRGRSSPRENGRD